jgi:YVTN family beta-propeller protein
VALVPSGDRAWLYVANRESGTISVIDINRAEVVAETKVGASLADLDAIPGEGGGDLLAVDEGSGRLERLRPGGPMVEALGGVEVGPSPVGVAVDPAGGLAFVALLWPRKLAVVEVSAGCGGPDLSLAGSVELPFEPRCLAAIGRGKVVVADAFGGGLAVVDGTTRRVESVRELRAHNIRGLASSIDGDRLLIAHQALNRGARTDQNDIHWAAFITSNLTAIPMSAVLDPDDDLAAGGRLYHLGDVGDGGADPNGVLPMPDGRIAVALGGVDEVAFGPEHVSIGRRVPVGRRPVALAGAPGRGMVFVADAFGDSVSLVNLESGARPLSIPLGPTPEQDEVRRGRDLFHDARLAHDGWMSCHSCHADGHTNDRLIDTLGDDSYGTPKRTLSLLGAGETGPWAWDGEMPTIGDQIRKSVVSTMRGYPLYDDQVEAIEAYLRSLPPPPALERPGDEPMIARGSATFRRLRCDRCHEPPTYTTPKAYDVGLEDERGRVEFNPPSLRGVARRRMFFHDGRAGSLADVFQQFEHQLEEPLSEEELADLLGFLRGL